jgi:RimJ/RimL family protein N-acetyltransferase
MPDLLFSNDIILEDDRVLLRPLTTNDFDNLSPVAYHDNDILQFSPKSVHTPEMLRAYIDGAVHDRAVCFRYPFIVFDKHANAYAGSTSYVNISNPDKRLEIGYTWYAKKFQRTGLNRHCKWLLLNYAFDTLDFERVEFRTDERNIQSRTAIGKLGAKQEGILRSHTIMSDGFRRNTVCFSILKDEWMEIRKNFPLIRHSAG